MRFPFGMLKWKDEKQRAQTEIQEIPVKHKKKLFYHKSGQTLEQDAQGCGVSSLEDVQNCIRNHPLQPASGDPALSKGWTGDF